MATDLPAFACRALAHSWGSGKATEPRAGCMTPQLRRWVLQKRT